MNHAKARGQARGGQRIPIAGGPSLEMELTIEDIVDFGRHMRAARLSGRREVLGIRVRVLLYGLAGIFLLHATVARLVGATEADVSSLVLGVMLALLWAGVPRMSAARYDRRIVAGYPPQKVIACRLWGDAMGMYDQSDGVLTRYLWRTVEWIDETPTHAFIGVNGGGTAVIVPRRIGEGQVRAFLDMVKAECARARVATVPQP